MCFARKTYVASGLVRIGAGAEARGCDGILAEVAGTPRVGNHSQSDVMHLRVRALICIVFVWNKLIQFLLL
jgi:hypothetical protein